MLQFLGYTLAIKRFDIKINIWEVRKWIYGRDFNNNSNYNKEKYIEKCVDSVLKQSYMPKEIIIVDDCSTDNSRRTIEKLAKKMKL